MKEKLEKVKEALSGYTNVVMSVNDPNDFTPKIQNAGQPARDALTLLDSIISMLDSPELVDNIADNIREEIVRQYKDNDKEKTLNIRFWEECQQPYLLANAVIEAIRG